MNLHGTQGIEGKGDCLTAPTETRAGFAASRYARVSSNERPVRTFSLSPGHSRSHKVRGLYSLFGMRVFSRDMSNLPRLSRCG